MTDALVGITCFAVIWYGTGIALDLRAIRRLLEGKEE